MVFDAVGDILLLQFVGGKVVPVHIKLQTKRSPCGYAQIAQPQFFVNEVKIIMKTFAPVKLQECPASCFFMPWFIGIALFHGREDVD